MWWPSAGQGGDDRPADAVDELTEPDTKPDVPAAKRAAPREAPEQQAAKRVRVARTGSAGLAPRRADAACIVAVGGLAHTGDSCMSVDQLRALAQTLGKVISLEFPCPVEHKAGLEQDGCTGEVALVTFESVQEAQHAVASLHGHTGSTGRSEAAASHRLWARQLGGEGAQIHRWRVIVRNVAFCANESLLRKAFSAVGFVWDLQVPRRDDGRKRGFAFVAYTQRAHAEQAIARLNGITLAGRAIAVDWALAKKHYQEMADGGATAPAVDDDNAAAPTDGDDELAGGEAAMMTQVLSAFVHEQDEGAAAPPMRRALQPARTLDLSQRGMDARPTVVVFAHNLPPEVAARDLQVALRPFTRVLKCRTVMDKVTGRSKGTAFMEFGDDASADAAISACNTAAGVLVGGRRIKLARAVSQEEARSLAAGKAAVKDKRGLMLAREGEILEGSPAAVGVSASDMAKRKRAAEERAEKLRNPNISVSSTRLHFRNLPASLDEKELKRLCVAAVVARLGAQPVVRARLLRDPAKLDAAGAPRSRGLGFVDMASHEHALAALRHLNNNPTLFGANRRPIVEFALDDARAARQHKLKLKGRTQRMQLRGAGSGPNDEPQRAARGGRAKARPARKA